MIYTIYCVSLQIFKRESHGFIPEIFVFVGLTCIASARLLHPEKLDGYQIPFSKRFVRTIFRKDDTARTFENWEN